MTFDSPLLSALGVYRTRSENGGSSVVYVRPKNADATCSRNRFLVLRAGLMPDPRGMIPVLVAGLDDATHNVAG